MYGNLAVTEFVALPESGRTQQTETKFIDAPTHMLPAPSRLIEAHFKRLLTKRIQISEESENTVDASEEMQIDETPVNKPTVSAVVELDFMSDVFDSLNL